MPRVCTVCGHVNRNEIDKALVNGDSLRIIANRFSIGQSALQRHAGAHVPELLTQAKQAATVASADSLLTQLKELTEDARRIGKKAEAAEDYRTALAGVRELVRIIELLAELEGRLNRSPQLNITLSAEWVIIRTAILTALAPYPDARQAVAKVLSDGNHSQ